MPGHSKYKAAPLLLKILLLIVVSIFIYYILNKNEKLNEAFSTTITEGWQKKSIFLLLTVLLMPINIGLEALKWKKLIIKIENINFKKALSGVLGGISMGFVTPHGIGDYFARIVSLNSEERTKGIGAVFLCRISQFYITLYFGSVSVVYFVYRIIQSTELNYTILVWFTLLNNILFILIFIYHKSILNYLETLKPLHKILPYINILQKYTFKEINSALLISLGRYLIFSTQFVLLLHFFSIDIPLLILFIGTFFVFFIKSIIPTFLDLGIRESSAVLFFGIFDNNHQSIIFAAFSLWIINIAFPAVIGLGAILNFKFTNQSNVK